MSTNTRPNIKKHTQTHTHKTQYSKQTRNRRKMAEKE